MSASILPNLHWDNSEGWRKRESLMSKYINQVRYLGKSFGITVDKSIKPLQTSHQSMDQDSLNSQPFLAMSFWQCCQVFFHEYIKYMWSFEDRGAAISGRSPGPVC